MSVSDKKRGPGIPEDTGKKRMDSTVICVVGLVLHETHKKTWLRSTESSLIDRMAKNRMGSAVKLKESQYSP